MRVAVFLWHKNAAVHNAVYFQNWIWRGQICSILPWSNSYQYCNMSSFLIYTIVLPVMA